MEPSTQGRPGYYVWDAPGQPLAVHLHLDILDRINAEVMRGFAAIPKRGAEVGGILLGTVQHGLRTIVCIDDFEPIACEYRHGPSYLLSDDELERFEEAVARRQPNDQSQAYAVGFYRSNTREGMSLAPEDLDLLDRSFPSPEQIALLIKPYATKAGAGGFFVRGADGFPSESPLEFPFRRRELTGEVPPPRRPLSERRPRARGYPATEAADAGLAAQMELQENYYPDAEESPEPEYEPPEPGGRIWVWIALSCVFLVLGLLVGYQAALVLAPQLADRGGSDLALNLTAEKSGGSLTVRWNRDAPALRNAQRGVLEIDDGGYNKPVDLAVADLKNGTLIYQNSSEAVRFRLTIFLDARLSVSETLEWRQ
jgi:hypothetical protein